MANASLSGRLRPCLGRRQKTGQPETSSWRLPPNPNRKDLLALTQFLLPGFASACSRAEKKVRAANERRVAVVRHSRQHEPPELLFNPDVAWSEPSSPPPKKRAISTSTADGIEVLVVEDNRMQQAALEAQLKEQGTRVTVVGSVKEGFRALRRKSFSLLLIDMELTDGVGVTLIACARRFPESKNHAAMIVGLSSNMAKYEFRCREAGADITHDKPVSQDDLQQWVNQAKRRGEADVQS